VALQVGHDGLYIGMIEPRFLEQLSKSRFWGFLKDCKDHVGQILAEQSNAESDFNLFLDWQHRGLKLLYKG
jgi:hypothetical protein